LGGNDIEILGLIGQGTFGKVYKGRIIKSGEFVAIKKVFQDPKYKNR
jgi:serine/threonine protein kinase